MQNQSSLQESVEIRSYFLRKIGDNENYFCITETFIFDTKRAARVYPAKLQPQRYSKALYCKPKSRRA